MTRVTGWATQIHGTQVQIRGKLDAFGFDAIKFSWMVKYEKGMLAASYANDLLLL